MERGEEMSYVQTSYAPRVVKDSDEVSVCVFDGVTVSGVYVGFVDNMKPVTDELTWRVDEEASRMTIVPFKELTLKEIRDQVNSIFGNMPIVVIVNSPLSGRIYSHGNHGDYWEQIGVLSGYA